ncbi:hypothetical protein DM50_3654 [Burkholderia mallei]|nr:hypothetical protein DM50_3654 [Burkholderia mallei]
MDAGAPRIVHGAGAGGAADAARSSVRDARGRMRHARRPCSAVDAQTAEVSIGSGAPLGRRRIGGERIGAVAIARCSHRAHRPRRTRCIRCIRRTRLPPGGDRGATAVRTVASAAAGCVTGCVASIAPIVAIATIAAAAVQ